MLEATGADRFGTYFAAIDRVLAPGGRAVVQTILVPERAAARQSRRRAG
jgi:cyclopropane fatty-acyl-phospholipid synthase-like methyltransferase